MSDDLDTVIISYTHEEFLEFQQLRAKGGIPFAMFVLKHGQAKCDFMWSEMQRAIKTLKRR
jgi:hypothetical protein